MVTKFLNNFRIAICIFECFILHWILQWHVMSHLHITIFPIYKFFLYINVYCSWIILYKIVFLFFHLPLFSACNCVTFFIKLSEHYLWYVSLSLGPMLYLHPTSLACQYFQISVSLWVHLCCLCVCMCMCVCVHVCVCVCVWACLVARLCLTSCDPLDCSLPGSSVHGISQARILELVAIFFLQGIFLILAHRWPVKHYNVFLSSGVTIDKMHFVPRESYSSCGHHTLI